MIDRNGNIYVYINIYICVCVYYIYIQIITYNVCACVGVCIWALRGPHAVYYCVQDWQWWVVLDVNTLVWYITQNKKAAGWAELRGRSAKVVTIPPILQYGLGCDYKLKVPYMYICSYKKRVRLCVISIYLCMYKNICICICIRVHIYVYTYTYT